MADSENTGQERTHEPSAKRLEDARREGQVPRSRDLAHLLVLGAATALLLTTTPKLIEAGRGVIARGLSFDAAFVADPSLMTARFQELTAQMLLALVPLFGVMLLAAVAAPLALGGWVFAPQMAAPKFDRLNPLQGVGRLLSTHSAVELLKVLIVALLLGVVGASYLIKHVEEFASLAHQSLPAALTQFGSMTSAALLMLVATLAVTSSIDVPFQLFQHHSKLKMTLQELKQENRETEGDPQIKGRIRQQQREVARKRMMSAVPKADVVVTNPTHFAVALKYMEGRHRAPVVVAKGADGVAQKIRELAAENQVALVEAPPLARALYKHVDIGSEIPAALYTAVAQVLAYVFQLKAFAQGRAARPKQPYDIEVPEGMDPLEPRATA